MEGLSEVAGLFAGCGSFLADKTLPHYCGSWGVHFNLSSFHTQSDDVIWIPTLQVLLCIPFICHPLPCLRRMRVAAVEFAQPPSCSPLHSLELHHPHMYCCQKLPLPLPLSLTSSPTSRKTLITLHPGFSALFHSAVHEEDESGGYRVCLIPILIFSSSVLRQLVSGSL